MDGWERLSAEANALAPKRISAGETQRPVFLHTGWRTAGSWLWAQFRARPGHLCYYEPLHEALAGLDRRHIAAPHDDRWQSHHPVLEQAYHTEFTPFIAAGGRGVAGFQPAFARDRFDLDETAELPALQSYLDSLLLAAARQGDTAVFKFCRSQGRAGWMMRAYPQAAHIAVIRNPVTQFASLHRQYLAHANPYFLLAIIETLRANRDVPRLRLLLDRLAVRLPAPPGRAVSGDPMLAALPAVTRYRLFLAFWLLGMLAIPVAIDAVLDTDRLATSAAYRRRGEAGLRVATGGTIDLSTLREASVASLAEKARPWLDLDPVTLRRCHQDAHAALLDCDDLPQPVLDRAAAQLAFAAALIDPAAAPAPAHTLGLAEEKRRRLAAEAALAAMRASTSWRVTAPLRAGMAFWRSRRGFGRFS
jgi:hypothetical protein